MPGKNRDQEKKPESSSIEEQEAEKKAAAPELMPGKIGTEQLQKWTSILNKYRAGKKQLENRVIAAENWWKLRNTTEEEKEVGQRKDYSSKSAWLHNVIVSKHADAMKAFPEAIVLPREKNDKEEAKRLSSIIPCIMEENDFEETYSRATWAKLKTGTGVYKIVWDPRKHNGLGDIAIYSCDLLNLFWQPGVNDIQKSRYFFQTELCDTDLLIEEYPQLKEKMLGSGGFVASKFDTDDAVSTEGKVTVIEVYYHKTVRTKMGDRKLLHYCRYVGDTVLYSSEDDPDCKDTGFYMDGEYPYEFDVLFPIEGSPCGYGFVDLCKNPQTAIDLMRSAMVRNMVAGATPRYFFRNDGAINQEEFANLTQELIHVNGQLTDEFVRPVDFKPLSGNYISALNEVISELRETSGNTETATGSVNYGVTAASAIAALQEASGKGSDDSRRTSYRCKRRVTLKVIERLRQFMDLPRQYRITGESGNMTFVSYSNENIRPQDQGVEFDTDMGYRVPEFDVKVSAAKKDSYSKLSQNELALQLYNQGMFNPQMGDMALPAVEMMEFEGKETVLEKIGANANLFKQRQMAVQAAMALCQQYEPQNLQMLAGQLGLTQQAPPVGSMGGSNETGTPTGREANEILTASAGDDTRTRRARERAASAGQPTA